MGLSVCLYARAIVSNKSRHSKCLVGIVWFGLYAVSFPERKKLVKTTGQKYKQNAQYMTYMFPLSSGVICNQNRLQGVRHPFPSKGVFR